LAIMESTPSMCPLCAQEGHSLGHEDHKRALLKLREKMNGDNKKKVEADVSCPLCRAEGNVKNHKDHEALLSLASAFDWELPEGYEPQSASSGCKLCRQEGTIKNHAQHKKAILAEEDLFEDLEFYQFDDDCFLDLWKEDPIRDFTLDEDEEDREEPSLWERIIKNIKDLLGVESLEGEAGDWKEIGGVIAMILLMFTGLVLVSFGLIELVAALLGDSGRDEYVRLDFDAEERMVLNQGAIQL
jgi:hypothetical protein